MPSNSQQIDQLKSVAEHCIKQSQKNGAQKVLVSAGSKVIKEFNVEASQFSLLRTTFDQGVNVKTLINGQMASSSGNQFQKDDLNHVVENALSATRASQADEANGFASNQGEKNFQNGDTTAQDDWMYNYIQKFMTESKNKYPKVILENLILQFVFDHKILATSDGTLLTSQQSSYQGQVMFTAKEGKNTSSFNYTSFELPSKNILNQDSLFQNFSIENLFKQSSEQTHSSKLTGKFEGDIIITPNCMSELVQQWLEYLGSDALLKKSSFFQNKLGEKVASPLWSLSSQPVQSEFATHKYWTSDGYLTQPEVLFENGLLKAQILNHHAAQKLKQEVTRSEGQYLKLVSGKSSLDEMISTVKKGVLMCRYSAGDSSESGEISGVAKNSYFIENGEIKHPLEETMVSGNLQSMLTNIKNISRESINNGSWQMPWVQIGQMTVS